MPTTPFRAGFLPLCLPALLACVTGCSGFSRPAVHPVTGHVFFHKTTPAVGAFVVFQPATEAMRQAMAARPFATVEPDGSFALTTYDQNDGAPEGEYGVTIVWSPPVKTKGPRISDSDPAGADKLGGRYGNPQKPALKATVQKGENSFRFDVE